MTDEQTAAELCKWLEPSVEPAGMSGAFWRAAGPRGAKRSDAAVDIEAHKAAIVRALQQARTPPPGHIIDDQGVVRRVLGTFVLTDEGCVVGDGAKVFLMSDNWRDGKYVYQVTASVDLGEPDDRKCFAEPTNAAAYMKKKSEAAEAAKEAK